MTPRCAGPQTVPDSLGRFGPPRTLTDLALGEICGASPHHSRPFRSYPPTAELARVCVSRESSRMVSKPTPLGGTIGDAARIRLQELDQNADAWHEPTGDYRTRCNDTLEAVPFHQRADENGFLVTGNPTPGGEPVVFLDDSFVESLFADPANRFVSQVERLTGQRCLNGVYSGATTLDLLNTLVHKVYPIVGLGGRVVFFVGRSEADYIDSPVTGQTTGEAQALSQANQLRPLHCRSRTTRQGVSCSLLWKPPGPWAWTLPPLWAPLPYPTWTRSTTKTGPDMKQCLANAKALRMPPAKSQPITGCHSLTGTPISKAILNCSTTNCTSTGLARTGSPDFSLLKYPKPNQ